MLNFKELDKNFFVSYDEDSFTKLFLHNIEDKGKVNYDRVFTVSEAFEIAQKEGEKFDTDFSAKCAWALDAILRELGKESDDYMNIVLMHIGDKSQIQYFGTNPEVKEQYRLANVVLGFEKGTEKESMEWISNARKLAEEYSKR